MASSNSKQLVYPKIIYKQPLYYLIYMMFLKFMHEDKVH